MMSLHDLLRPDFSSATLADVSEVSRALLEFEQPEEGRGFALSQQPTAAGRRS
jgi:hypothetical protein